MQVKPANRHVLFLQGPGTLFFYRLAQTLENAGIATSKIHFSPGDRLFWRSGRQAWFTGPLSQWPEYLKAWIEETRVSDIVLFSDSRPYHKQAVSIARACGVNVFVFENGYLRPHWITLQLGGVNGSSPFPRTRKGVEELAQKLAGVAEQPEYSGHFTPARHLGDMVFHTINYFYGLTNRNFVSHRPVTAMREAAGWWKKFWTWPFRRARSTRVLQGLLASRQPFFLFSLQLDNDYQLVEHSPFDNIHQACEHVIASFANYAPPDCQLLIKNHPLDNNLVNRERDVAEIARRHAISDRVHYIETGNNPQILEAANGMVTINSTMGTSSLFHKLPTCVLGTAVYDMEGLTHQAGLDRFWSAPEPPDMAFFEIFRRTLIADCQIAGSFNDTRPSALAYARCAAKIICTPANTARTRASQTAKT